MQPVEFKGQNTTIEKDSKVYNPLPAFVAPTGEVITCWELTHEDFVRIVETKRIYLLVATFNQPLQPLKMTTDINEFLTFKED